MVSGLALIFTNGAPAPLGVSAALIAVLNALVVPGIFWYLTYFMYRRAVFIKIRRGRV